MDSRNAQTMLFTFAVIAILTATFWWSFNASGIYTPPGSEQIELDETEQEIDFANITESEFIDTVTSGMNVLFTYTGPEAREVRWDFGHNDTGATGEKVIHPFENQRTFLVTMHVTLTDGSMISGFKIIEMDQPVIKEIPIGNRTFYLFPTTLLIMGMASLTLCIFTRVNPDIPPRAFTPRLRWIFGIFLIFNAILAFGLLNPLTAVPELDPTNEATRVDAALGGSGEWLITAMPAIIVLGIFSAVVILTLIICKPSMERGCT